MSNKIDPLTDGSITETAHEAALAWQDHNAEVYQGLIVQRSALRQLPAPALEVQSDFDVGPVATERAYAALGRNKGTGPDGITNTSTGTRSGTSTRASNGIR